MRLDSFMLTNFKEKDLQKLIPLQPKGWDDIKIDFQYYLDHDFCKIIKIEAENQLCGVGVNIIFGKTAWLSHIIVNQAFRKQGIGTRITKELLKISENHNVETTSLIATDLGKPIYKKAGFREELNYIYLKRKEGILDFNISNQIRKANPSDYQKVLKLDQFISGENRTLLISEYLNEVMIYETNEEVLGYFIPNLGNEPIYAVSEEAGIELMKFKYSKITKAALPETNETALNFLFENGFEQTDKKGTRMVLGKKLDWKPKLFFSRIGGNFG